MQEQPLLVGLSTLLLGVRVEDQRERLRGLVLIGPHYICVAEPVLSAAEQLVSSLGAAVRPGRWARLTLGGCRRFGLIVASWVRSCSTWSPSRMGEGTIASARSSARASAARSVASKVL